MSCAGPAPRGGFPVARCLEEFALTTILLFVVVTVVRWLRDPVSPLYIADLAVALVAIGAISGCVLTALILSPLGKRSGGHMNPAVTVMMWLMRVFPGRNVLPYALAQLAGSAAGAALARFAWGPRVSAEGVDYAAVRPGPGWGPAAVFLAELGTTAALVLVIGFILTRRVHVHLLPYVIGLCVGLVIATLGSLSGGCLNPARQLGPAALSAETAALWIYLVAPLLGSVLGVAILRWHALSPPRRR